jgi:hypothetical protein
VHDRAIAAVEEKNASAAAVGRFGKKALLL